MDLHWGGDEDSNAAELRPAMRRRFKRRPPRLVGWRSQRQAAPAAAEPTGDLASRADHLGGVCAGVHGSRQRRHADLRAHVWRGPHAASDQLFRRVWVRVCPLSPLFESQCCTSGPFWFSRRAVSMCGNRLGAQLRGTYIIPPQVGMRNEYPKTALPPCQLSDSTRGWGRRAGRRPQCSRC